MIWLVRCGVDGTAVLSRYCRTQLIAKNYNDCVTHKKHSASQRFWPTAHDRSISYHVIRHRSSLSSCTGLVSSCGTSRSCLTRGFVENNTCLPRWFGELHTSCACWKEQESSKVEKTTKVLEEKLKAQQQEVAEVIKDGTRAAPAATPVAAAEAAAAATSAADVEKKAEPIVEKKSLPQRVWAEIVHYYHGFRLLFLDARVAVRLVWHVMRGHNLSRRERRQLVRTTADMFRMVPFLVFIVVPFMEFLLPVYLKLFPGMLPSTFQTEDREQAKLKKRLKVQLEMAKFLQDTVKESTVSFKQDETKSIAKDFAKFMQKIRYEGGEATTEEIRTFSKFFEDELTLDNLSSEQLVALCRILDLQTYGTDNFLRFQLRMKLRALKNDDALIQKEGFDGMSVDELQKACRERGMRVAGLPEYRLKLQLKQWLQLHLGEEIPTSLLLLSRALFIPEYISPERQLASTMKDLPTAMQEEATLNIADLEGLQVDPKEKHKVIRNEEKSIKKEKEEQAKQEKEGKLVREKKEQAEALADKAVVLDAAGKAAETLKDEGTPILVDHAPLSQASATAATAAPKSPLAGSPADELRDPIEKVVERVDTIIRETYAEEAAEQMQEREEIISSEELGQIGAALENIVGKKEDDALAIEKEELAELKEEVEEYKEDIYDLKEMMKRMGGSEAQVRESKASKRLQRKLDSMIGSIGKLVVKLETEKGTLEEDVSAWSQQQQEEQIGDLDEASKRDFLGFIDQKKENIVSISELVGAVKQLQKSDLTHLEKIADALDPDHDGRVSVQDALHALEELEGEGVPGVSSKQLNEIITMLQKERGLEQTTVSKPPPHQTKTEARENASVNSRTLPPPLPPETGKVAETSYSKQAGPKSNSS